MLVKAQVSHQALEPSILMFEQTHPLEFRRTIPASITARENPALKNLPLLQSSMEAARYARPMPPLVEMRAAWDGMQIMIQKSLAGTETVDEAVKTGHKVAEEALAALRDPRPAPAK